jgi:hypothetical protein
LISDLIILLPFAFLHFHHSKSSRTLLSQSHKIRDVEIGSGISGEAEHSLIFKINLFGFEVTIHLNFFDIINPIFKTFGKGFQIFSEQMLQENLLFEFVK